MPISTLKTDADIFLSFQWLCNNTLIKGCGKFFPADQSNKIAGVFSLSLLFFPPPEVGIFQSVENSPFLSKNYQTDFQSSSCKVIDQIPSSGTTYSKTI